MVRYYDCSGTYGSRLTFTLPSSLYVSDDGSVSVNTAPGTPSSISYPTSINGGTDIAVYGTTASTGEAGRILVRYAPGISEYGAVSWEGPEAETYAQTLDTALATIDAEKRNALYAQCQELLMENYVCYPIWHKEINAALQPDVKGFYLMPTYENHYLQYVYFA